MNSKFLTILLLNLILAVLPTQASGTNNLPPISKTQAYVDNLISSYNSLANGNFATNPNFGIIKQNLTLYHDVGTTFKVIVMQSAPNASAFVTMIFTGIGGNDPIVILDTHDNYSEFGNSCVCEFGLREHLTFDFNNTESYITLAWTIRSTDITQGYVTNSTIAARTIYEHDAGTISKTIAYPGLNQPNNSGAMGFVLDCFATNRICIGIIAVVGLIGSLLYIQERFSRSKTPEKTAQRKKLQAAQNKS